MNRPVIPQLAKNLNGSMAEQLALDLFLTNRMEIYRYGVHRLLPSLDEKFSEKNCIDSFSNENCLRVPKFLIMIDGNVEFLNVYFRNTGYLSPQDVEDFDFQRFPSTYVLLFSNDEIYLGKSQECLVRDYLPPKLEENNFFNFSSGSIDYFQRMAQAYFEGSFQYFLNMQLIEKGQDWEVQNNQNSKDRMVG